MQSMTIEQPRSVPVDQPRSGARMQPRAQALGTHQRTLSPERAKEALPQTCGNIVIHLIFSTKDRRPMINPEIRADLFAYLGGIIREMRGTALIINGTADHVHVLARIRPAQSAAEIARVIKTNSSRWVHEKRHIEFVWQAGYGVFSVSESNVASVTRYIAAQEAHHQKQSFKEEFLAFLQKNNVAYDEAYLWD
jgi:putative transposase